MKSFNFLITVLSVYISLMIPQAQAQAQSQQLSRSLFTYEGFLKSESTGQPVSGSYPVQIEVTLESASSSCLVHSEDIAAVNFNEGEFLVNFGSRSDVSKFGANSDLLPAFKNTDISEIQGCVGSGAILDREFTLRVDLGGSNQPVFGPIAFNYSPMAVSADYALKAKDSETLGTKKSVQFLGFSDSLAALESTHAANPNNLLMSIDQLARTKSLTTGTQYTKLSDFASSSLSITGGNTLSAAKLEASDVVLKNINDKRMTLKNSNSSSPDMTLAFNNLGYTDGKFLKLSTATSGFEIVGSDITVNASNITSGVLGFDRLPVGTTSTQVAVGNDSRFPVTGSACLASQYSRWSGSSWECVALPDSSDYAKLSSTNTFTGINIFSAETYFTGATTLNGELSVTGSATLADTGTGTQINKLKIGNTGTPLTNIALCSGIVSAQNTLTMADRKFYSIPCANFATNSIVTCNLDLSQVPSNAGSAQFSDYRHSFHVIGVNSSNQVMISIDLPGEYGESAAVGWNFRCSAIKF